MHSFIHTQVWFMATIGRKSQSSRSVLFLLEWPLTQTTTGNIRQPVVCKKSTPQIKRQKIEHRSIVEQNEPCMLWGNHNCHWKSDTDKRQTKNRMPPATSIHQPVTSNACRGPHRLWRIFLNLWITMRQAGLLRTWTKQIKAFLVQNKRLRNWNRKKENWIKRRCRYVLWNKFYFMMVCG